MDARQEPGIAQVWKPQPHDLILLAISLGFALLSFLFPDGKSLEILGLTLPRSLAMGMLFLGFALLGLLAPLVDERRAHPLLLFLRTFYPQALFGFFFLEAILLSGRVAGGIPRDAFFAALDQALFGFQPALAFSARFSGLAWLNELMFGSYFLFYVLFAVTPWIPWFLGRRAEARRQVFVFSAFVALLYPFYVVCRVMGPKYWFPELNAAWYGHFQGGLFVRLLQGVFEGVTLSGAAFPSAHVTISTLLVLFAARIDRRLLLFYVPAWGLIFASTVYLYAHYVVDGLAGMALALLLGPLLLAARKPSFLRWARKPARGKGASKQVEARG